MSTAQLNETAKVPKRKALSLCQTKRFSFWELWHYSGTLALPCKPGVHFQTKDPPHDGAEGGSGGNDDVKHSHVRDADGPEEDGSGAEPRQGQSSTPLRGLHRRQHQACRFR